MRGKLALSLVLTVFLPLLAWAEPGVITIESTGSVAFRPDQATISVGVEVEAPTAEEALRTNSDNMRALFGVLEQMGISEDSLRTTQLSVYPRWDNRRNAIEKPMEIVAFAATNTLEIRINDLDRLGTILDALIDAGANRIHGVRFGVQSPDPHLDEARRRAVAEARRRAELYAEAAGMQLGALLTLSESSGAVQPMVKMEAMALDAVPVAEGSLTLSASITVTYALVSRDD